MSLTNRLKPQQRLRWIWFAVTSLFGAGYRIVRFDWVSARANWEFALYYITGIWTGWSEQWEDSEAPWKT